MSDWQRELNDVISLNARAGTSVAESRFRQVIDQCDPLELYNLEAEVDRALASFPTDRRPGLKALLAFRRMANPTPRPVPVPTPAAAPEIAPRAPGRGVDQEEFDSRSKEISELLAKVRPGDAEAEFRRLVDDMHDEELVEREHLLLELLEEFLPKRRRALILLLEDAFDTVDVAPVPAAAPLAAPAPAAAPTPAPATAAQTPAPAPPVVKIPPRPAQVPQQRPAPVVHDYNYRHFTDDLDKLSRLHIFQWATFYRDVLSEYFEAFLEADDATRVLDTSRSALLHHASEIFTKGYTHITTTQGLYGTSAVNKSLTGLQRFLDLPLEFYSARLADAHRDQSAKSLRRLASAWLMGILMGYGEAQLDQTGRQILPRFPRSWAHVLPFLTTEDLRELITELEPGRFTDLVGDTLMPLVDTLDKLIEDDPLNAPLPALSQFVAGPDRLDVSLQLPPNVSNSRSIDVQCYLFSDVSRQNIEEASARAVSVVIARLRSDLRGAVAAVDRLAGIVVPVGGAKPEDQVKSMLERAVDSRAADSSQDRAITWNYARNFPLENPFLAATYNHVYRGSVRALMQSFERRNGVRLWCSVRRSGKTTACTSDLGSTTGQTVVVTQTCDDTGQLPSGGVFYGKIVEALANGRQLSDDFVAKAVNACQTGASTTVARYVLVLDEYETLFGLLSSYLNDHPSSRYLVIQPLLNQLVRFTRDNLLVFMGQQPNAHHILLDQNQLSPVIEQDSFPLFTHDSTRPMSGEFYELLRKVMTNNVDLDPEFVTMVYAETGGHPFLTVKLLVAFMDWLIHCKYRVSDLNPVRADTFATFAKEHLTLSHILRSQHYDFFQGAAEDHLSAQGRRQNPWLHDVYTVLRRLRLDSPDTLSCTDADYEFLAVRAGIQSPARLLATARAANFLAVEGGAVRARIPILARIAAAVNPDREGR